MKTSILNILVLLNILLAGWSILYLTQKLNKKEQIAIDYYNSTELLLDSIINENDSIFSTKIGIEYIKNKQTFESRFINKQNYEQRNIITYGQ